MPAWNNEIKLVILESPYAGVLEENLKYARYCALDCARRNEATIASHLHYTQFLDDKVPEERHLGIRLGLAWRHKADYSVFYVDRGWSNGMMFALASCLKERRPFFVRALNHITALALPGQALDEFIRSVMQPI
jgi:hypothetical protein